MSDGKLSSREELELDVREWAERNSATQDPYVNLVISILNDEIPTSTLNGMPFDQWFPQPRSRFSSRVTWAVRLLSITRNVFIFAPVAITWYAISRATEAFNLYVQQSDGVPVNFLQFWQDGYGYLPSTWTISNVALLDFVIILGIALLSLAIGGGQTFGNQQVAGDLNKRNNERRILVMRLILEIPDGAANANISDKDMLDHRFKDFLDISGELDGAMRSLRESVRNLTAGVTTASKAGSKLAETYNEHSLATSSQAQILNDSLSNFTEKVNMLAEVANKSSEAISAVEQAAASHASMVENAAVSIQSVSDETKSELQRLRKTLARIGDQLN